MYHRVWCLAGNQLSLLHFLPRTTAALTLPAIPTTLQSMCQHAISMHVQVIIHFEQNMVMNISLTEVSFYTGKELYFNAVNSSGYPYLILQDSFGSTVSQGFPPFTVSNAVFNKYAKCQTYKLLEGCEYNSACSATIRIDGGMG